MEINAKRRRRRRERERFHRRGAERASQRQKLFKYNGQRGEEEREREKEAFLTDLNTRKENDGHYYVQNASVLKLPFRKRGAQ
jgi:hypothetical protein